MKRLLILWGPVALYAAVTFVLSAQPHLPSPPGGLSDKHAHFLWFAGFCAVLLRALCDRAWRTLTLRLALLGVLLTVLYGVSDEFHQHFVPGRTMDAEDLLADTLGALTAAGLLLAWAIIRRRSRAV